MSYDPTIAFRNPTFDRSEMEVFIAHKSMPGEGKTLHYIGEGIENMAYAIAVESTEKKTIAQRLATVSVTDGGITFPAEFELRAGCAAYDAIVSAGLLGLVNEEFEAVFLYGNIGVRENGALLPDAPFAQRARIKLSMSQIGGAGVETITVTAEGKTSGDIEKGYMLLEEDGVLNYDPDARTWKASAFVRRTDLGIGDLVIGGAGA